MYAQTHRTSGPVLALRWLARVLSLGTIGIIGAFAFGEGTPTAAEWLLLAFFPIGLVVGLVLAWWREIPGALLALGSMAAFYAIHFVSRGTLPAGPYFAVLVSPAVVFLAAGLTSRMAGTPRPPAPPRPTAPVAVG
jgi:hypothetical protein